MEDAKSVLAKARAFLAKKRTVADAKKIAKVLVAKKAQDSAVKKVQDSLVKIVSTPAKLKSRDL